MNFRQKCAPAENGFMAIELLAVLAIILVLFCLYWGGPLTSGSRSKYAACAKNLEFIHTAMATYAMDNNDRFPFVTKAETSDAPLTLLIPKYTTQTASFICPASGDRKLAEGESFAKKRISYAYVMGLTRTNEPLQFIMSDEQIDTKAKAAGARVFSADGKSIGNNHGTDGGNLLFVDGSVQQIAAQSPSALGLQGGTLLNPKPKR
jgi:prepilin-type processing-associated H-X9-DG protein